MNHTTTQGSGLVHATLARADAGGVVLALEDTDYQLHLAPASPIAGGVAGRVGKRITGVIRARARRVDVVGAGGRFIEPVVGRPRRVQGAVTAIDPAGNTITVHCAPGCQMVCALTSPGQKAGAFATPGSSGTLVSFDVEPGATFEPA